MPRVRSPEREKAKELYLNGGSHQSGNDIDLGTKKFQHHQRNSFDHPFQVVQSCSIDGNSW